jgi:polysaccharide pyruvyl transferase WcaK-like protein
LRAAVERDGDERWSFQNPMKVLIIDGLHDSDRGGAGIVAGLVDSLYSVAKQLGKSVDLALVYRYSAADKRFRSAARHTRKSFPDVEIYSAPLRTFSRWRGLPKKLDFLFILLTACVSLVAPRLSRSGVVRAMQEADVVISKGGHFYRSGLRNPVAGFIDTLLSSYNLMMAIRLRKRLALVGHSVGPFSNVASRWLTGYAFKRASFVSTRESISKQILVEMGIAASRIAIVPDTAFALTPAPPEELSRLLDANGLSHARYAVVTPRYWDFPGSADPAERYTAYLHAMATLADHLLETALVDRVLLVRHNDGQHLDFEDDAKPIEAILEAMKQKQRAIVIRDDLSPTMQAALYGRAIMTLGTRMHSVIFAFVGGGPAVAVSYTHKTDGMMSMMNLEQLVLPIDSIDLAIAREMITNTVERRAAIVAQVAQKVADFREVITAALTEVVAPP